MADFIAIQVTYIDQKGQRCTMRLNNVKPLPISDLYPLIRQLIDGEILHIAFRDTGYNPSRLEARQLQEQRVKAKLMQSVPPPGIAPTDIEVGEVEYYQDGKWKKDN